MLNMDAPVNLALQSLLFVPGTRPERIAKALASGADCVCIDLEDSVPAGDKAAARQAALAALGTDSRLAVRINGLTTRAGLEDLLALAGLSARPSLVLVPMVESAAELTIAAAVLSAPAVGLVPLIETVAGLEAAAAIAAHPAVAAVMFGGADLAAQLGVALAWEPLALARARLVLACGGAGKVAIDVPWLGLDDPVGLEEECRRAKGLGFAAKAAIHPAQVATIHQVFRPSAAELAEAEAAVAAFAAGGGVAVRFNGTMLEAPVMGRFRRLLELKDKWDA